MLSVYILRCFTKSCNLLISTPLQAATPGRIKSYVSPKEALSSTEVIPTRSAPANSSPEPSPTNIQLLADVFRELIAA